MSEENGNILDLGSIDFTPDWAKRDAGVSVGKIHPERDAGNGLRDGGRGSRKPFGDRRSPGGHATAPGRRGEGGRQFAHAPFDRKSRFEEVFRPLEAEVKVLPETKALGTIIRKLQSDAHAYKLKDLAYFFLDNPSSILLKVTPKASAPQAFFQCKVCGFASTKEEEVLAHAVGAHLGDYYDSREVEVEPPKGSFSCVAKCGLSGVLLGPPNIHEFNAVVREMVRTRYPEMTEEQYRARIEMVRDAEAIEAWRAGATKKTLFFAKGASGQEGAPGLSREAAEGAFRRTILPSLVEAPKRLMITAEVAMKSPDRSLQRAVRDALEAERRNPYNMCFALRGAFHHRKLHFFRANDPRGQEFVSGVEYREFDVEHAIPELASVAKFVAGHPCCDKSEFPPEADFEKHLNWLVTTGHVVAFTNGVFSSVEKFPKYGPQWKKRQAQPAAPTEVEKVGGGGEGAAEPVAAEPVKTEEKKDETAAQLAE